MKENKESLQIRLYLVAASVLLLGLGCAAWIYLQAENDAVTAAIDGLENSKSYAHDLELYGGKANLIANEIRNWFAGIWHGKALASTVAFLTVAVAFCLSLVAHFLPANIHVDVRNKDENHI